MECKTIETAYDMVVAGGGITGAGVFHEAVKMGYKVLLVEANDFSWGTSSRSSKMIHGGLRYLKQGKLLLTRSAVRERERLLKAYPGLVEPLKFIMPLYTNYGPSRSSMKVGLSIYSKLSGTRQHQFYTDRQTSSYLPWARKTGLDSSVGFKDAQVDDARLVLRLIQDACDMGGTAVNYTRLSTVHRDKKKKLSAVGIVDAKTGEQKEIQTRVLINATGIFTQKLHPCTIKGYRLRPLRGSHLIFHSNRFFLDRVISFIHPQDLRPVFIFPWEGCILLGTTDIDHDQSLSSEPVVTLDEADYLMEGLTFMFPDIPLTMADCIGSMAGVRPVLSRKSRSASRESREHVVWKDKGVVSVTGGKLTTFRLLARDALNAAKSSLPIADSRSVLLSDAKEKAFAELNEVPAAIQRRILGRYGRAASERFKPYGPSSFSRIHRTRTLGAELMYAAQYEQVRCLADLLLRRVRIGLLLPFGGKGELEKIETLCKPYLDWDDQRWAREKKLYLALWEKAYSPPGSLQGGTMQ